MEYCRDGSLFRQIEKIRKKHQDGVPEKVVVYIAAQLFLALRYLHEECGIVHRDLK